MASQPQARSMTSSALPVLIRAILLHYFLSTLTAAHPNAPPSSTTLARLREDLDRPQQHRPGGPQQEEDPQHEQTTSTAPPLFNCPPVTPTIASPSNISELHPAHVSLSFAVGDSITAAFAALSVLPLEFRGSSFSGGAGAPTQLTLPYFLRFYNATLQGAASESFRLPTEIHWQQVYAFAQNDHLNAAVSGSWTKHWDVQFARIHAQLTGEGGDDGPAPGKNGVVYENWEDRWKVITVFLGENDLCNQSAACGSDAEQQTVVDNYRRDMDVVLQHLVTTYRNVYVNLIELFWMKAVFKVESEHWRCMAFEKTFKECPCLHDGNDDDANKINAEKLGKVADGMNVALRELAERYDGSDGSGNARPDVGVNVIRAWEDEWVPDVSYLSMGSPAG